jgi:iron(III) transport system permease protein
VSTRTFQQEHAYLWGAGLLLALFALLPLAVLSADLLTLPGALARTGAAFIEPTTWGLLGRSIGLAAAVTALALVLGVPLGFLLGRTDLPGRSGIWLLHAFPMFVPPFLLALGWFYLFGRQGLWGSVASAQLLFSEVGVIAVLTLAFTPIVTSLMALALRGIDPSLEEAARVVASPGRVALRVSLPLVWPAGTMAALIVFALALSELGVPMFLRVQAYPAVVFARLGGIQYAPGEAFALVAPLFILALVMLAFERRLLGTRSFASLGLRRGSRVPVALGRYRTMASACCCVLALLAVTPLLALTWRALKGNGFAQVPAWIGNSLTNSLVESALAATLVTVIGLIVGWAIARKKPGARFLDAIAVLAFVTPAAVLGVGLIAAWNRPATQLVYSSLAILVFGFTARYGVIGVRTIASSIVQSSPRLEETAAAYGAGFTRRLMRVIVPLHVSGVGAAWLLTMVFCLRDLETAVLFYPAGLEPLTVRIFTLEANGPEAVVAALSLIHVAVTAAVLALGGWFLHRGRLA